MTILMLIASIICIGARCVIFKQRDVRWWKALIPAYNKYILGKLANQKKLGIFNAIAQPILYSLLFVAYFYELWIMNNFQVNLYDANRIIVEIPDSARIIILTLRYSVIILAAITIFVWSFMMYKFSSMHGKSSWWIIMWAICPAVGFSYFALSDDVYIDNKHYRLKKELVK